MPTLNVFLQLSFYCGWVGKSFNPRCLIGWTLILDGHSLMQSTVFRTVCHRNDRSVNHFILWLNKQWHEVWFANTPCCMTLYEPETTMARVIHETSTWQETSRVTWVEIPSLAPGKSVSARFGKGLRIVRISVISTHSQTTPLTLAALFTLKSIWNLIFACNFNENQHSWTYPRQTILDGVPAEFHSIMWGRQPLFFFFWMVAMDIVGTGKKWLAHA